MRKQFVIPILAIVILSGVFFATRQADQQGSVSKQQTPTKTEQKPVQPPEFNAKQFSLDDPASMWVVVNKKRPLNPQNYTPNDLRVPNVSLKNGTSSSNMHMRDQVAVAVEQMFAAAQAEGVTLRVVSAYRSYDYQARVYGSYVKTEGQTAADAESARAGYSEHQTGLAVDVGDKNGYCDLEQCFGDTSAGKWIAANAYKHGFIVRYGQGLTNITGYLYEPWHVRFVGKDLSTEMNTRGVPTLEQFFGLGEAADY